METGNNRKTRLQKLSRSDFEIVPDQPDIRGWEVKDSYGKHFGKVAELTFDYESRKVRYIVVNLDENDFDLADKEILVPIGIAELHETDDDVILPGVTPDQLMALPEYDEDRFDTEHEAGVLNVFGGLGEAALHGGSHQDEDIYNHDHFNENNLYRKRQTAVSKNEDALLPGESANELREINPGGVRLRTRSELSSDGDEIKPGTSAPAEKDDKFGEYPLL